MLLLAVCDYRYRLTYVHFGDYGSEGDGRVFERSDFRARMDAGQLGLPGPRELPGTRVAVDHFFVADAAFPLNDHIMKPLPGQLPTMPERVYNYR